MDRRPDDLPPATHSSLFRAPRFWGGLLFAIVLTAGAMLRSDVLGKGTFLLPLVLMAVATVFSAADTTLAVGLVAGVA